MKFKKLVKKRMKFKSSWCRGELTVSKDGTVKRAGGYPSKLEAAVHDYLVIREKAGEITNIQRQQQVTLQDGPREERITWRLDFSYEEKGEVIYVEAKGFPDATYKLKLKIWRKLKPYTLEIYGGNYRNIKLMERIKK